MVAGTMTQDTDQLPLDKLDLVGWGPDTCQKKDEEQYCWSPSAIPETVLTTASELEVSGGSWNILLSHKTFWQDLGIGKKSETHLNDSRVEGQSVNSGGTFAYTLLVSTLSSHSTKHPTSVPPSCQAQDLATMAPEARHDSWWPRH